MAPGGISLSSKADLSNAQVPEILIEATACQHALTLCPGRVY